MKCPRCQAENPAGATFCNHCGFDLRRPAAAEQVAAAALAPSPQPAGPPWRQYLDRVAGDPTGLLPALVVLVVALAINLIGWKPLGLIPGTIGKLLASIGPSSCSKWPGLIRPVCVWTLALYVHLGSMVVVAVMLYFRKAIARGIKWLMGFFPKPVGFLTAPVVATFIFTMTWAGVPFHFFDRPGLVRDGLFPTVVGVASFLLVRYDPPLKRWFAVVWAWRDKLSLKARAGTTMLVLLVVSWLITGRVNTPVRDQVVVLVSMLTGYLMLSQRRAEGGVGK